MKNSIVAVQSRASEESGTLVPAAASVEISELINSLSAYLKQWDADNETFTVEVMRALGTVRQEARKVIDVYGEDS